MSHSIEFFTRRIGCCAAALLAIGCEDRSAAVDTEVRAEAIDPATIATRLVTIPELEYEPAFRGPDDTDKITVASFAIEEHAVTNAQFSAFVRAVPKWQRSRVASLFGDSAYLSHWRTDIDPGVALLDRPVTQVSWFAARGYAEWLGRRLPTVEEWEVVGAASESAVRGADDPKFVSRILDWYARPTPAQPAPIRSSFRNVLGVWDQHGLIWEWVDDFNTALVTGESRGDTGLERNSFCGAGSLGSADPSDYAAFMRFAFRSSLRADYGVRNLGFRCAADLEPGGSCCANKPAPAAATPLPDASIYQLAANWTDQSHRERQLADFRGRPIALAMVFTHCAYACPRIVADLKSIETGLTDEQRAATSFVLVSMDSERDLPDVLAAWAREHDLDPARWTLLHGDAAEVRELAAVLGVQFKRLPDSGDYSHSNLITLLDRDGSIAHRHEGLAAPVDPAIDALARLTAIH